jgi:hypothetical protein
MSDPTWMEVELVDNLADDIDTLNGELPAALRDITTNQPRLCELLYAIRGQRIRLAELEATVEAKAARSMGPADRIEWDGYYAERKGGSKRSHWDHKRLAARVTEQSYVDPETGEVDATAQALTTEVVGELLGAAAISYWRTTILRSMGIDYDDAVETERGRRTVHVTKGSAA